MACKFTVTDDYKKQIDSMRKQICKEISTNKDMTCNIEFSDKLNPFNTPEKIYYIFKIKGKEFSRITYESQAKIDNRIHYAPIESNANSNIDDIMNSLPFSHD